MMLWTLRCGLPKQLLRISTSSNYPDYGNPTDITELTFFPNHATEVRCTQGSRKLAPGVMGNWGSAGHKRGCGDAWDLALASEHFFVEVPGWICWNSGVQHQSSHQIISA